MSIFKKVLKILERNHLCRYCIGRMFAMLATNTTNLERANSLLLSLTMQNHQFFFSNSDHSRKLAINNLKILAEKANFLPAQKILIKEGFDFSKKISEENCHLCMGIFEKLDHYADLGIKKVSNLEFSSFLVGSSPDPEILNKEDKFKSMYTLLESESIKSHFNREVGKIISEKLNILPEFEKPDITLIFNFDYKKCNIEIIIRSLFIFGRYKKLLRGIPQTKWPCGNCGGKGCKECDFTGKQYKSSVEELISPPFIEAAKAEDSKFHGAGREDIDVKMLGTGRPFILELMNPKIRSLNLEQLKKEVNERNEGKIEVSDLRISNKQEVITIKERAEFTKKVYKALVKAKNPIDEKKFKEKIQKVKEILLEEKIEQRTPQRVSHRRADKIRKKKIFEVKGEYLDSSHFEFIIKTQGGTYIKELISGDEGRTKPSFSSIFNQDLVCTKLDVIEIIYNSNP